ncbi:cupin domain-containing protein [Streptomyces sp. 6N223]|uniref:cupin domain-containing protein n=1 Tax=Streptomyces sp. 6N223 TaxID=3457412 RepID=UPI003FD4DA3F
METRRQVEVLARVGELLEAEPPPRGGVVWRLAVAGRQLDANLVRLPPGGEVAAHGESELDVLVYVVEGGGRLGDEVLSPGSVAWLPRGATRSLTAGPDGLVHLTVHLRRPGMSIGRDSAGGESACLLHRVCLECGRFAPEPDARYCARCGTELPSAAA